MKQQHKNGIVFHRNGNYLVSRDGIWFEVTALKGSDGGPEFVQKFTTKELAINYANELADCDEEKKYIRQHADVI